MNAWLLLVSQGAFVCTYAVVNAWPCHSSRGAFICVKTVCPRAIALTLPRGLLVHLKHKKTLIVWLTLFLSWVVFRSVTSTNILLSNDFLTFPGVFILDLGSGNSPFRENFPPGIITVYIVFDLCRLFTQGRHLTCLTCLAALRELRRRA